MVDFVFFLAHLLFFGIPLLYYYINLRSSVIFCLYSKDTYLFLGISLSCSIFFTSFLILSELFCDKGLKFFVILSVTFTNQTTSSFICYSNCSFSGIISASFAVCFALSRRFCYIYCLIFYICF